MLESYSIVLLRLSDGIVNSADWHQTSGRDRSPTISRHSQNGRQETIGRVSTLSSSSSVTDWMLEFVLDSKIQRPIHLKIIDHFYIEVIADIRELPISTSLAWT